MHRTAEKDARLKSLFHIVNGATPKADAANWDGNICWATPADVGPSDGGILSTTARTITEEGLRTSATEVAPAGSIVLSTRAPIGHVALTTERMAVNQGCRLLVPKEGVEARFYSYVLHSRKGHLRALGRGSTFLELGTVDLGNLRVPLPSIEEQRAVVRFLDEETAKIDTLIDKKARLVELPQMARDALAEQCFSKIVKRTPLRRVIQDISDGPFGSSMKNEHYSPKGARVIRLQNIGRGTFVDSDRAFVPLDYFDQLRRHDACPGDLLVAGLGDETNRVGRACLVPQGIGPAMVKADCFRLRLNQGRALHSFVMHYLNSPSSEPEIQWQSRGATRTRMNSRGISGLRVPLPDLEDQAEIVRQLNEAAQSVAVTNEKVNRATKRLREYRAVLITAAVTGQIDVRADRFVQPASAVSVVEEPGGGAV